MLITGIIDSRKKKKKQEKHDVNELADGAKSSTSARQ